jgi:hypothetical protein
VRKDGEIKRLSEMSADSIAAGSANSPLSGLLARADEVIE